MTKREGFQIAKLQTLSAACDGDQHGVRDDDSGAGLCAGSVAGGFDHGFGDCVSDRGAGAAGRGFFSVSDTAACC